MPIFNNNNLFEADLDNIFALSNDKEQWYYIHTHIYSKLIEHNSGYMGHILLTINSNYCNFIKFLEVINTNSYVDISNRFFLLKTFLTLSSRLILGTRLKLTKLLWSVKSFRDTFCMFNVLFSNTSIKEKHSGPFCSLFPNKWTNEYSLYIDALTPLLKDDSVHSHILTYINQFINLNSAYVEGNFEYIEKNCSTVDFNCAIIHILLEMIKYVIGTNKDILQTTINKAINVMYIPLVNIKHDIYSQLSQTAGTTHEHVTKQSLNRLMSVYDDQILTNAIKEMLPSITQDMSTTYELKNMCIYILEKFKDNYLIPQLVESVKFMKDFIMKNDINDDTASIFLDLSLKKVKINIEKYETKQIINGILEEFLRGDVEIVNSINALNNLLSLFEQYGELSVKNHSTLHKMLKKMNILISPTADTYMLSHKSTILIYYLNITKSVLLELRKHNGWLEPSKNVLNNAVSIFVIFSLLNIPDNSKQSIVNILKDCITLCELTKIEASVLKIKLKSFITHDLKCAIDGTLNHECDMMMYDYLFPDHKLINPIFVPIDGHTIIVDASTLSTDKLKEFIEGKITLPAIEAHNNTPNIIMKKLELIAQLNSHVPKV